MKTTIKIHDTQWFKEQTEEAKFEAYTLMCKEVAELKTVKIPRLERKIASMRGAHSVDCRKLNARREQVERLKNENAELKAKNKWYAEQVCNKECAEVWGKLTKAKDIIAKLVEGIRIISDPKICMTDVDTFVSKAEQFLKETKE